MRIIIEIEDGAVRATREEGAAAPEAVNVGGPPAELLRLLGAQPRPLAGATGSDQGAAVNV
ncbi:MAG: hypothetical protein HGA45_44260, partial [Chloroflexales bacterium]|nr:hypothetical protein [Chloroflexales bacterium]